MRSFTTLNPDDIERLLEGQEDILTGDMDGKVKAVMGETCPRDGTTLQPVSHPTHPFGADGTLRLVASCASCKLVMDPKSGLILSSM